MHLDAVELLVTLPMTEGLQSSLVDCAQHPTSPEVRRAALRDLARRGDEGALFGLETLLLDAEGGEVDYNQEDVTLARQAMDQILQRQGAEEST